MKFNEIIYFVLIFVMLIFYPTYQPVLIGYISNFPYSLDIIAGLIVTIFIILLHKLLLTMRHIDEAYDYSDTSSIALRCPGKCNECVPGKRCLV